MLDDSLRPVFSSATRPSLVEGVRGGDPGGWDRLVSLYGPLLAFWARMAGIREQDFNDVCQDVYRVVVLRIDTFRLGERKGSFRAWLRAITLNVCRERSRENTSESQAAGGTDAAIRMNEFPDKKIEDDDPPELVAHILHRATVLVRAEFSDRDWALFELLTRGELSPTEIAADLGITVANVRAIKSRVYRRLREELGDLFDCDHPPPVV